MRTQHKNWFPKVSNYCQNSMIFPGWIFQNPWFFQVLGSFFKFHDFSRSGKSFFHFPDFHDFSRGWKPWLFLFCYAPPQCSKLGSLSWSLSPQLDPTQMPNVPGFIDIRSFRKEICPGRPNWDIGISLKMDEYWSLKLGYWDINQ